MVHASSGGGKRAVSSSQADAMHKAGNRIRTMLAPGVEAGVQKGRTITRMTMMAVAIPGISFIRRSIRSRAGR